MLVLKSQSNVSKIARGFLSNKKLADLKKEIKSKYVNSPSELFDRSKDDIRMKMFNYEHPIAEKTVNGVMLRIAEGLIRDKKKTYLLYANKKIVGEFNSVQDIKYIIKFIEENLYFYKFLPL